MRSLLMLLTGLMITLVNPVTLASVPTTLNYQGYLTDASGAAVDDTVSITFNVYSTESGGTTLWTSARSVPVSNGLFSLRLGEAVPFPADLFDTPLWIGVSIDADAEMTPRRALTSAGFAFNADELQGQPASAYDQSAHVTDTSNPHSVTAAQTGALTAADITTLQADLAQALLDIAALQSTVTTLQTAVTANTTNIGDNDIDILDNGNSITTNSNDVSTNGGNIAANLAAISTNTGNISANASALATISNNSVLTLDSFLALDQTDPLRPAALFNGVNVQIVSGSGATDAAVNGKGNLIIGYDELTTAGPMCSLGEYDNQTDCETNSGTWASSHKSGSHNVVIGRQHNYSRYGGLVAGLENNITGESASVTGGNSNTASSFGSSVSGGGVNTASGAFSSVSGGISNTASNDLTSVSGGDGNTAGGFAASVSGGNGNTASGYAASASGGENNTAFGNLTSISGGEGNTAIGNNSSVSGGQFNTAGGWWASVSGGENNSASGFRSSVSGGANITASNGGSWQGGDTVTEIVDLYSNFSDLQTNLSDLQSNVVTVQTDLIALQGNSVLALDSVLSLDTTDPLRPAALFTGVNVQVVNGLGATAAAPNGTGNVIVGYNEIDNFGDPICSLGQYDNQTDCENNMGIWAESHKSGSHNVVIGDKHNYSRYGGLVAGFDNNITGGWAVVSGGTTNTASGPSASVSGGEVNTASGAYAVVSGGQANIASGTAASVSGGILNTASGTSTSVSGGRFNTASGPRASVSGGEVNTASGWYAVVSGGENNTASGESASVSGGRSNTASGESSSVSGGSFGSAPGLNDWRAGSLFENN